MGYRASYGYLNMICDLILYFQGKDWGNRDLKSGDPSMRGNRQELHVNTTTKVGVTSEPEHTDGADVTSFLLESCASEAPAIGRG